MPTQQTLWWMRQRKGNMTQKAEMEPYRTALSVRIQLLRVILLVLEAVLKHKKKQYPLTPFTQTHLFNEGYWDHVPGDDTMVHELQEGSQGESQHLTVTKKKSHQYNRQVRFYLYYYTSICYKVSCLMSLQQAKFASTWGRFIKPIPLFQSYGIQEPYWDRSLVPLSTSRVSTVIPSMLMNSVAKVTSAESLASSFMASSRTSILCDWILSISWRAALDWEGGMMPLQSGDWVPSVSTTFSDISTDRKKLEGCKYLTE